MGIMNGWERVFYTLSIALATFPLATLRFAPFRRDLRIPMPVFWGIYTVFLIGELTFFNLYAWPFDAGLEMKQKIYFVYMILYSLLFFLGIRRFLQQVFVFFVLAVYGMMVFSIPVIVEKATGLEWAYYVQSCLSVLIVYALTWRWMYRILVYSFQPLYRSGTRRFWHYAWLLPASFFIVEVVLVIAYTHGDWQANTSLVARIITPLGVWAGARSMFSCLEWLQGNKILMGNLKEARGVYESWKESCLELSGGIKQMQRLHHDLRHYSVELEHLLDQEDWAGYREAIGRYRIRLLEWGEQEGKHD